MVYKKGFTLITALLMVLFVSLAMAVIGTVFVKSTQISGGIKVFKTTKEAAETTAYVIMEDIDNGNLKIESGCTVDCDSSSSSCEIELPEQIKWAIKKSKTMEGVTAYLISKCPGSTSGSQIYTIKVEAKAKNGATTNILFIYEK